MRKFIFKFISHFFCLITLIVITIIIQYSNSKMNLKFDTLPKNNLSNNSCFRAKLDHLVKSENYNNCTFLISGSSMSLNNISGQIISKKTNECVYNISAWGTKSNQILELFNIINKRKIKYLLLAFNTCDFNVDTYNINFKDTERYLINGTLVRYWLLLKEINFTSFIDEWKYRTKFSNISNTYESLNFDITGSIQFEHKEFIIDSTRWKTVPDDTSGFNIFHNNINRLYIKCRESKIKLFIVFLPARMDLLNEQRRKSFISLSKTLRSDFQTNYIDLSGMEIPLSKYCDGIHFFKDGAEDITKAVLDSLSINKKLFLN